MAAEQAFDDEERKNFKFDTEQFEKFVKGLVNKAFLYKLGSSPPVCATSLLCNVWYRPGLCC